MRAVRRTTVRRTAFPAEFSTFLKKDVDIHRMVWYINRAPIGGQPDFDEEAKKIFAAGQMSILKPEFL